MASGKSFVADLHIHSYLSRATSKQCDLPRLALWAQQKGIRLLATGDFTHPEWFSRIEQDLVPGDNGLFSLRPELAREVKGQVPAACQTPVDFILQVEISSIYKRGGAVRKVHNLVYMPDLQAARKLCEALGRIGNIGSDGRPILGLDSRDLLEIVLECSDRAYLIPAHIWTPWFSVFGSKSGFDSLEECYGDLTDHIFALETGLSSDPPMNWRLSQLDGLTLVSNSDAHSPSKLGREANLFHTAVTYDDVFDALHSGDPKRFGGTLEFYPEEGKYHLDGCRRCGVRLLPPETREHGGRCPECGKLITVGVMSRVEELADREPGARPETALGFSSLVPLQEVLGACFQQGPATKRVQREYDRLLGELGPELTILRSLPVEALRCSTSPLLGEAIRRTRAGELHIQAGYDGEFGQVGIFGPDERDRLLGQADLFPVAALPFVVERIEPGSSARVVDGATLPEGQLGLFGKVAPPLPGVAEQPRDDGPLSGLSEEQRRAVCHDGGPLLIVAGPGAGKTRTLTRWLSYRIQVGGVPADGVLAVTFTNRAARELRERLSALLGASAAAVTVSTFHGLGFELLRRHAVAAGLPPELVVLDEHATTEAFALELGEAPSRALRKRVQRVGVAKLAAVAPEAPEAPELAEDLERYRAALQRRGGVDYADLILRPTALLAQQPELAAVEAHRWACIAVDEYQDIDPRQRDLLKLICGADTELCAIGDPDQSIYGFRGADVSLFTGFGQDFQGVRRAVLSRSYRSTPAILKLAHEVVRHTPDFGRVEIESMVPPTVAAPVELQLFPSVEAEAVWVSRQVEELVGGVRSLTDASERTVDGGLGFGDIAVLARTGARLEAVDQALGVVGIPVERVGMTPADADDELAVVALLRLSTGRETPADLLRLLARWDVKRARLSGLLPALAAGTVGAAVREGQPVGRGGRAPKVLDTLGAHVRSVLEGGQGAAMEARLGLSRAAACLELRWPPDPGSRALTRLWALAEEEATLGRLLDRRDLQTPADAYDARAERVALLTIHAAKGLEFEAVFVVGCEDGTLPWIPDGCDEPESASEERRLLYVAMTRARHRLWLGAARRIRRYGTTREVPPSRFLSTVSPSVLRVAEQKRPRKSYQHRLDL